MNYGDCLSRHLHSLTSHVTSLVTLLFCELDNESHIVVGFGCKSLTVGVLRAVVQQITTPRHDLWLPCICATIT